MLWLPTGLCSAIVGLSGRSLHISSNSQMLAKCVTDSWVSRQSCVDSVSGKYVCSSSCGDLCNYIILI